MSRHTEPHPLAGQTVVLGPDVKDDVRGMVVAGEEFRVEDWWDRVSGTSWMNSVGNPAAIQYAIRSGIQCLPLDDEVVYGHIGHLGHLVHVSELPAVAASGEQVAS